MSTAVDSGSPDFRRKSWQCMHAGEDGRQMAFDCTQLLPWKPPIPPLKGSRSWPTDTTVLDGANVMWEYMLPRFFEPWMFTVAFFSFILRGPCLQLLTALGHFALGFCVRIWQSCDTAFKSVPALCCLQGKDPWSHQPRPSFPQGGLMVSWQQYTGSLSFKDNSLTSYADWGPIFNTSFPIDFGVGISIQQPHMPGSWVRMESSGHVCWEIPGEVCWKCRLLTSGTVPESFNVQAVYASKMGPCGCWFRLAYCTGSNLISHWLEPIR